MTLVLEHIMSKAWYYGHDIDIAGNSYTIHNQNTPILTITKEGENLSFTTPDSQPLIVNNMGKINDLFLNAMPTLPARDLVNNDDIAAIWTGRKWFLFTGAVMENGVVKSTSAYGAHRLDHSDTILPVKMTG